MENANKDMQRRFAYEVKKWYRTNNHLKLDYVLSYFDKKNMKLEHYCAPLNIKDAHWVTLDVSLPNETLPNGRVMTTDHMHEVDDPDPISKSSCNSRMWWAKYFGIYNKEKCGVNMMDNSFFSSNDLNHDSFTLEKNDKSLVCSSLDHSKNNDPNLGKQHDRSNCGIWVLLEMFNRIDDGYKIALGDRSFDQLETFRKYLFTLLIRLYQIMVEENYWEYDWESKHVVNDTKKWMKIFASSIDDGSVFNNRWDLMKNDANTPPDKETASKKKSSKKKKKGTKNKRKGSLGAKEDARRKKRNKKRRLCIMMLMLLWRLRMEYGRIIWHLTIEQIKQKSLEIKPRLIWQISRYLGVTHQTLKPQHISIIQLVVPQ